MELSFVIRLTSHVSCFLLRKKKKMQHILAPTGTEDVPPFYYQSVLCFWDQTFGGKGTEKFILENKKFLFYFYLQDRFSCLPFFTSHILWNKLSVSSGSQSPSLGM